MQFSHVFICYAKQLDKIATTADCSVCIFLLFIHVIPGRINENKGQTKIELFMSNVNVRPYCDHSVYITAQFAANTIN